MLKIGIVGVGQFGQNHARILSEIPECEFVGLYDLNPKRALEIATRVGTKAYPDYTALLAACEALVIVVTTVDHYRCARQALDRGIHVFIEKPVTAELWQAQELVELAREKDLRIQVGHIERFNPVILEIADKIKDPIFAECHRIAPFSPRGTDVPVVLELMIHDIDLILAFVSSGIKEIRASGAGVLTRSLDIANARLEFQNGAVANVTASRISMKRSRKLRFFQKDAYFSIDFMEKKVTYIKKSKNLYKVLPKLIQGKYEGIEAKDVVDIQEMDASQYPKDALTLELEAFIHAVENGSTPLVDGQAGMRALEIALEIIEKINK